MPLQSFSGTLNTSNGRQAAAAAGKYFNVTNPTPGTAIAYATVTGFSATANGLFAIANTGSPGGANIQLDRLLLIQTAAAPTGTLVMRFEAYSEFGNIALGTAAAARTPVNVNPSFANATSAASVTSFAAGAGTVPAAGTTRRLIDIGAINTGVTVIHDTFVVDFGGDSVVGGTAGLTAARATASARSGTSMAPVTIPPGYSAILNMWWVTQAANIPSFEFALSWIES